jgi:tRNA(adenine34) deaminase
MKSIQQNSFTALDHKRMKQARALAKKSLANAEVPVGALITDAHGVIIGRGFNQIESKQTQHAHAEMQAIAQATRKKKGWRLDDCTLYVTLEPCMMCLGSAFLSRVKTIIYGAPSHLFGLSDLHADLPAVYRAHTIIYQGLQQGECSEMLKHFFSEIRSKQEALSEQDHSIYQQDERKPA